MTHYLVGFEERGDLQSVSDFLEPAQINVLGEREEKTRALIVSPGSDAADPEVRTRAVGGEGGGVHLNTHTHTH